MSARIAATAAIVVLGLASGASHASPRSAGAVYVAPPAARTVARADALAGAHRSLRAALQDPPGVHLVAERQHAHAVLVVIGAGAGAGELRQMFRALDPGIMAPPVLIGKHEHYIGALLTVGSCSEAGSGAADPAESCVRRVFVGADAHTLAADIRDWLARHAR
jgi:hypothetical protein